MATLNPRVNVTLSPSLFSLVDRLASLERVSKATVLRELLEAAEPSLLQAVALMEAAQGATSKARKNLAEDLSKTLDTLVAVQDLAMGSIANKSRDIVAEAETVRGRRPKRGALAAAAGASAVVSGNHAKVVKLTKRPPSSNRGVKS